MHQVDTKTCNTTRDNAQNCKASDAREVGKAHDAREVGEVGEVGEGAFAHLVRASRTYRRFDESQRLSADDLRALVDIARFAPTANNLQRLRFRLACDEGEVARCLAHHKWAALLADWDGPAAGERPVAYIAVCAPVGSAKSAIPNIDAGIAAQTIMLAARTRGLGGCMVKSFDDALNDDLGLREQGLECLVLLTLGHPTERVVLEEAGEKGAVRYWRDDDDVHHVPKLSLDELIV